MQLSFNEASNVIIDAIHFAGENIGTELRHAYSTPANQSYLVEITDFGLAKILNSLTQDYEKEDHTFSINIPYDYFSDDVLPIDQKLGINAGDAIDTKAELRCMNLIQDTWQRWIKDHNVITTRKELLSLLNIAIDKLRKISKIDLQVHGNKGEIAEKYIECWFSESHLPSASGSFTDRWFQVTITLKNYYAEIGAPDMLDNKIGISRLKAVQKTQGRAGVCVLRIARLIYEEYIGLLQNKWPNIYQKFINGEF